jgi:hypothetical protein
MDMEGMALLVLFCLTGTDQCDLQIAEPVPFVNEKQCRLLAPDLLIAWAVHHQGYTPMRWLCTEQANYLINRFKA